MNIVCLTNGSTDVRERSSDGVEVLPCGCASTERSWLQMCREHGTPCWLLHGRAASDHDTEVFIKELTS